MGKKNIESPRQESIYISLGLQPVMVRAELAIDRRRLGDLGGVDAVIYSAMAVEAFPNDFAHMASIFPLDNTGKEVIEIVAAAQILAELEEQRAQPKTKYQVLYYILAKTYFPKDNVIWADCELLMKLRNELVHPKPENIGLGEGAVRESRVRKLVHQLRQRNLIARPQGSEPHDWSFILEDDDHVAVWAVKTAKSIIQFVASKAPDSVLRDSYLRPFIDPGYVGSRLWSKG